MPSDQDAPKYYTITDAAEKSGVRRRALYQWVREGKITQPGFIRREDGRRFFNAQQLDEIIAYAATVKQDEDTDAGESKS